MTDARVRPVTIEHHRQPLGIGEAAPRLSWITDTEVPGWAQRAYELAIDDPATGTSFQTGRIDSADQVLVDWPTAPLDSRARRQVRVRVWGPDDDAPSAWSEPTEFETGLLDATLWRAQPISMSRRRSARSTRTDWTPTYLGRSWTLESIALASSCMASPWRCRR